MSDKEKPAAECGCTKMGDTRGCPCNKRICLPILGLVGVVVVASLVAKARSRK